MILLLNLFRDLDKISDLARLQDAGVEQTELESLGFEISDESGYSNYTENDTNLDEFESSGYVSLNLEIMFSMIMTIFRRALV